MMDAITEYVHNLGQQARAASRIMAAVDTEQKTKLY